MQALKSLEPPAPAFSAEVSPDPDVDSVSGAEPHAVSVRAAAASMAAGISFFTTFSWGFGQRPRPPGASTRRRGLPQPRSVVSARLNRRERSVFRIVRQSRALLQHWYRKAGGGRS